MKRVKVVFVGDSGVGKTCMLISYASRAFPTENIPTVFSQYSTNVRLDHQRPVSLSLWDTASQDSYVQIRPLSYPKTSVFLVCFSVTNPGSLGNVLAKWWPEIRHHCSDSAVILVGTKTDLREDPNTMAELAQYGSAPVNYDKAAEIAREIGAVKYMECSAYTQKGLKDVFEDAIRVALEPERMAGRKKDNQKCRLL